MHHIVFNFIDSNVPGDPGSAVSTLTHYAEVWSFEMADGKMMHGLLDLKRTK
jgi:hypothetical protein